MKPLPPAVVDLFCRAATSGSSGRGNGMRSITTRLHDGPGHVDALPQRQRAEQAGLRARRRTGGPARAASRPTARAPGRRAARASLGRLQRGALRGEQPERAAAGGLDQPGELVEERVGEPVATGTRQVARGVEDALALVGERRADVERVPARALALRPIRRPGRAEPERARERLERRRRASSSRWSARRRCR